MGICILTQGLSGHSQWCSGAAAETNSSFCRYQDVTDVVLFLSTDNLVVESPLVNPRVDIHYVNCLVCIGTQCIFSCLITWSATSSNLWWQKILVTPCLYTTVVVSKCCMTKLISPSTGAIFGYWDSGSLLKFVNSLPGLCLMVPQMLKPIFLINLKTPEYLDIHYTYRHLTMFYSFPYLLTNFTACVNSNVLYLISFNSFTDSITQICLADSM